MFGFFLNYSGNRGLSQILEPFLIRLLTVLFLHHSAVDIQGFTVGVDKRLIN